MATSSLGTGESRAAAADAGLLVLRLVLGILILCHGLSKLPPPSAFVVGALAKADLPGFLAYGVYLGEVLGPILVIVGLWTRLGALLIVINMLFAVALAHPANMMSLGASGGYVQELQAMYLFVAVALVLLGAGRYSVGGRLGRMN